MMKLGKFRQTNTVETINNIFVTFNCDEFVTFLLPEIEKQTNIIVFDVERQISMYVYFFLFFILI